MPRPTVRKPGLQMAAMNPHGFTLLELMILTVLLGILSAFALPVVQGARARASVRHAADEFVAAHSLARSMAVRQGRVARLYIDATDGRFWVEIDTTVRRTGARDTIGILTDVSRDQVALTSSRNLLCFDARGLATRLSNCPPSGAATLVFTRAGYDRTVLTSSAGKVLR